MEALKQARLALIERHIRRMQAQQAVLDVLDQRYVLLRVAAVLGGAFAALLAASAGQSRLAWGLIGGAAVIFAALVWLHRRVDRSRANFRVAKTLAEAQRARMTLDWEAIPAAPVIEVDPSHPFAADLNILGERSLHRLLDTAATRGGSERLAEWLLAPIPDAQAIRRRQVLIGELLPLSGLRTRLAKQGVRVRLAARSHWNAEKLLRWLKAESGSPSLPIVLFILVLLAAANITLYALNALGLIPGYWIISLAVYGLIYIIRLRDYQSLFDDIYLLGRSLDQLKGMLACLEEYPFTAGSRLSELCAPFWRAVQRPSRFLKRLAWLTSAASLGSSQMTGFLVNLLLPWNLFFAYLLRGYKTALSDSLELWLDVWYELEALNSLAEFAYLNPGYCFPQPLADLPPDGQPVLDAHCLGHPLIADEGKVCNDFSLSRLGEVAIITGSNMSGKSTFLRTLGVNLILAQAGSVVNAERFQARLLRVFTCIQVSDSLSDGISYFYAEVRRLKALLQAVQEASDDPVFFLIDEIYRGTNNRERRIGSQAYVRALAGYRAVGLVSTHDLELVRLAEPETAQGGNILNYHFREDVLAERMVFDYRLRPGPCPTTNALRIMALEGLPVDPAIPAD